MRRKWLICVCIVGICMSVSGCNNSNSTEQTTSNSQGIEEAQVQTDNSTFISNKDNSIQIKASYKGDDSHYDEYNITIQPANNTLGFTISGVSIIPK